MKCERLNMYSLCCCTLEASTDCDRGTDQEASADCASASKRVLDMSYKSERSYLTATQTSAFKGT
jgi:hypothetical protein